MSELTIYQHLRAGGLSPAGACAVMGNMFQESAMQPNNVENRCTISDSEYTRAVDDGRISPSEFVYDKFGYGLCQWTWWSRKKELWQLADTSPYPMRQCSAICASRNWPGIIPRFTSSYAAAQRKDCRTRRKPSAGSLKILISASHK